MGFGSLNAQQRVMVLLELLGGPKFATETRAAAASMGYLGKATETTGRQAQLAGRRMWVANQALYTLRRYAFYGTLALTAMGTAVIKLGYNYLSAMQQARVALHPVIKDHATLEGYLNRLFRISKYSPFVITDLAVSFRQMVAGFAGTGFGPVQILNTIQALTDALSFAGKIGPGQLNRVTLALQHMAFQGRLTGRVANQLGMLGIPVSRILKEQFGIPASQMHNIANLNIPPGAFLTAMNRFIENTTGFKGAALKLSLRSVHGLLQVVRDSVSQISGNILKGPFGASQGFLFNIAKPGGPLDRISAVTNRSGGSAGVLLISKMLTGSAGLGGGFLLLLSIVKNIGAVFAHILVPAFVIALHTLIIFYPVLKAFNWALGFLVKHASVAKWVFAAFAAEFVITHFAMLGVWTVTKLLTISTYGLVTAERVAAAAVWLTNLALVTERREIVMNGLAWSVQTTKLKWYEVVVIRFRSYVMSLIASLKALRAAMIGTGLFSAIGAAAASGIGAIAAGAGLEGFAAYKAFTTPRAGVVQRDYGYHTNLVAASGQAYIQSQGGGRLTRAVTGDGEHWQPIQLVVDRQVMAEVVARAKQDKAARR